jgi:RimJ/RimL family protein N-acetyltransferase
MILRDNHWMDSKKITFKKAAKADKKLIQQWLGTPHVKEYWDSPKEVLDQFDSTFKEENNPFTFWICLHDKTPFALILTTDAHHPKEIHDHLAPWIEQEGTTLLIDFVIGDEAFIGKGLSAQTLIKFAKDHKSSISALLCIPEVKNEKGLHVFEKAGFARVSTFIKGKGFFKGKPHYLLKMKL